MDFEIAHDVVVVTRTGFQMMSEGRRGREEVDAVIAVVWNRLGGCLRRPPS